MPSLFPFFPFSLCLSALSSPSLPSLSLSSPSQLSPFLASFSQFLVVPSQFWLSPQLLFALSPIFQLRVFLSLFFFLLHVFHALVFPVQVSSELLSLFPFSQPLPFQLLISPSLFFPSQSFLVLPCLVPLSVFFLASLSRSRFSCS